MTNPTTENIKNVEIAVVGESNRSATNMKIKSAISATITTIPTITYFETLEDAEQDITPTRILKLTTSYTCNATCVSCGAGASSSWAQLDRQTDPTIPIKKYKFIDIEKIKQDVDFKELKMLWFSINNSCSLAEILSIGYPS